MACFGSSCYGNDYPYYDCPEEARLAKMRNKQITKVLKDYQRQEMKKLKILLLGKSYTFSNILQHCSIIFSSGIFLFCFTYKTLALV
jgi:hypothetical protein